MGTLCFQSKKEREPLNDAISSYSTTYSFNKEKMYFERYMWDNIIGGSAYFEMSETEMLDIIAQQSLDDLRSSGFDV